MKKWVGFLAALWLAAGALAPNAAIAADSVKIGVLMPLTGNAAAAGQASKAAIEVAADIVNAAHPELGNIPLAATAGLPHLNGAKLSPSHKRWTCTRCEGRLAQGEGHNFILLEICSRRKSASSP